MNVYDVTVKANGEKYNMCIELSDMDYVTQNKNAIVEATTEIASKYFNLEAFEILTFDNDIDINVKVCF